MTIQLVVFDIDDTLYLERAYVRSGFLAVGEWVRAKLGIEGFSDVAWRLFEEGLRNVIFDRTLEILGIPPSECSVPTLVDIYRRHRPTIALTKDSREALDHLRSQVPIAIVTDGPLPSQRAKVQALGLRHYSNDIILTSELGPSYEKPNPYPFALLQDRYNAPGNTCVYVADNPLKDFAGPKSLGWRTIRVRRDGSLHHSVPTPEYVDIELPNLSELQRHPITSIFTRR